MVLHELSPTAGMGDSAEWLRAPDSAIPMLPDLANRVIQLASDPDIPVTQLTRIISKDQVLTTRLLSLANSAYCAPMMEISTVTDAIVRLGTSAVRNLVVTVSFTSRLQDPQVYGGLGPGLSDHAVGTAYCARLVAEHCDESEDEAFLFGLVHDIGKLVILKMAHDHRRRGHVVPPEELDEALRQWHPTVGGLALRRWYLPPELDEPVMCHHDYTRAQISPRRAAIAYLANRLSHRYGFGCPKDEADLLQDPALELLGVDAEWLGDVDQRGPGLFAVAREILR